MSSLVIICATFVSQASIGQTNSNKILITYLSLNQILNVFEVCKIDFVERPALALYAQFEQIKSAID